MEFFSLWLCLNSPFLCNFFFNLLANYWLYSSPVFSMRRHFVVKLSLMFKSQQRGDDREREREKGGERGSFGNRYDEAQSFPSKSLFNMKIQFNNVISCFRLIFCFILLRLPFWVFFLNLNSVMNKISKKDREKKIKLIRWMENY